MNRAQRRALERAAKSDQGVVVPKQALQRGMLAIPHTGVFDWAAVASLMTLNLPPNTVVELHGFSLVYEARERVCQKALDMGLDWIMMVDSDMVIPSDTVHRLLAHNLPIVSGLAFKRSPPYQCCAYERVEETDGGWFLRALREWPEGLMEVAGVGTACILIRREALEAIPQPWFFPVPGLGEDLAFCDRARKAGIPIRVDTTIKTRHLTTIGVSEEHYRYYAEQHRTEAVEA